MAPVPTAPAPPLWLLAELTYRCPLQCPYCSNPLDFAGARFKTELTTEEWCRVFREARSEEHTSELQSQSNLVCRLLLEKKKNITPHDRRRSLTVPTKRALFTS